MIYTKSLVPAQTGVDDTIHKDGGISMSHRIITIEREYASGGREIGELIANRLGIPCYNREILKMASERCNVSMDYLEPQKKQHRRAFYIR